MPQFLMLEDVIRPPGVYLKFLLFFFIITYVCILLMHSQAVKYPVFFSYYLCRLCIQAILALPGVVRLIPRLAKPSIMTIPKFSA